MTVDNQGNTYLADGFSQWVVQSPGGVGFNTGGDSVPLPPFLNITTDSDSLWVADGSATLTQFAFDGQLLNQFAIPGVDASPATPTGIIADPNTGLLYVSLASTDYQHDRIAELSSDGTLLNEFGTSGSGDGQFALGGIGALGIDNYSHLYVADRNNNRIQVLDAATGQYITQFGNDQLLLPSSVAVDATGNEVWVIDSQFHRILVFSTVPEPASAVLVGSGAQYWRLPCIVVASASCRQIGMGPTRNPGAMLTLA